MAHFSKSTPLPVSAAEVFAWHLRPGALDRLLPPWERVKVVERAPEIEEGSRVVLQVPLGPLRRRWVAEHRGIVPGRCFSDVQVKGPLASWEHEHRMEPKGPESSVLEDRIAYRLPLGLLGELVARGAVRTRLERLFRYRHHTTGQDLSLHRAFAGASSMNLLVTGSSGLIGSTLVPLLTSGGHQVRRLGRRAEPAAEGGTWDPERGVLDPAAFEGIDAVVHLAGENIAGGRWTPARKELIRRSRVQGTRLLAQTLARLEPRPRTLVCASAIGFYGHRGEEMLDEGSAPGEGFLAGVCREWEEAAAPARARGIRVVHLRFGVVLSPRGGALARMLLPFKLGLGGRVGGGDQWMSWISIDDAAGAILQALQVQGLEGPVNVVAPHPVTNQEFTRILGSVLRRPTLFPLPARVARVLLGEMAEELLLGSTRVQPSRLQASGYRFRHPTLESALRHLLGRGAGEEDPG